MNEINFEILSNEKVGKDIYRLAMKGDVSSVTNVGQFAMLSLPNHYLRRPISIHEVKANEIVFLYKILGQGTKELSTYQKGNVLPTLVGLGNGFDITKAKKPLLIGGGIGIAPLYDLAKQFSLYGIKPIILLGFKTREEVFYEEEFKQYGDVIIVSDDGTYGEKGNPVSYLKNHSIDFDYYYACGPYIMLKYLTQAFKNGEVSLEARMGCGFGACMGCSIMTKNGVKRICKEGPVFLATEVDL